MRIVPQSSPYLEISFPFSTSFSTTSSRLYFSFSFNKFSFIQTKPRNFKFPTSEKTSHSQHLAAIVQVEGQVQTLHVQFPWLNPNALIKEIRTQNLVLK